MRLTKLEMQGFKSFADHTHLAFEPGATAIVGPNGCGKSNVSDAVRWVLGEQRARVMRGANMQEVIFQGSSARRPVNVAEVSLHFENDDGTLPVPFREVVITRRLSRSGDSDYFLNRAPCRLRDIHDLVRGTGLGADSGVVIESKMIDALLSDRPDDRRELFEEASGVGLYRDRRRTTERRLEETSVDLSRLDDLINEVQSQVRSLARQRKRAERSTELQSRRFLVDLTLASREMAAWKEELERLTERVASLREQAPDAQERVRGAEATREGAHAARAAAEARRAEIARLVSAQHQSVLQLQGEIAVAEERQRNAVARRHRAEAERREGMALGERVTADRDRAAAERRELEAGLRDANEEYARRAEEEELARAAVAAARAAVERAERAAREPRDELRRVELESEGAQREHVELSQRLEARGAERQTLADQAEAVRREVAAAEEAIEVGRIRVGEAAEALGRARASALDARNADQSARQALSRASEVVTALQSKVGALEGLERERVGLAPAAARLLQQRERFGEGALLGPLSDYLGAGSAEALLLERFLGNSVHAIIVRDREVADAVRVWHTETRPGPLLLLPLDAWGFDAAEEIPDGTLAHMVQASEPVSAWVKSLLGHVHAVDDGAAYVDGRGAVFLPGSTSGPGPLRRRAELAELRAQLAAASDARARAAALADASRAALERAQAEAVHAGEAATTSERDLRAAEEHRMGLDRRRQRFDREQADADALLGRLRQRLDTLTAKLQTFDERTRVATELLETRERERVSAVAALTETEHALEAAREARTQFQVQQAQAQARLQVAADRERRLTDEHTSTLARIHSLQQELDTLGASDRALAEQMAGWKLDLESRSASLADARERAEEAEEAVKRADAELTQAEQTLAEIRRMAGALADELHAAELRYTELSGRRAAIQQRLETEWRRPVEQLFAELEPLPDEDESLREEGARLREQLETLGPVNPLAIEEHDAEVKRLDFLTSQRADLAQAKLSLLQAIKEIDSTAREMFLATFTRVRENFRHIFMTLFGGGECDIRLENPDSPLDCDIEIHASPRGKRTQRIHLLSSGERALVALSLLFGIFLTKPSPFCLLDEVDAPLDDQNIGRFVRMLNQFKTRTQFIVITHNPRTTTEAADAVYGVTMQEPGVSSIVGVRMRGRQVDDDGGAQTAPVVVGAV